MSKPDVTFVSGVSVHGFLNGVVNLSLSTTRFVVAPADPAEDEMKVVAQNEVAVDLRFDLYCAQQIRDALDKIIEDHTKAIN